MFQQSITSDSSVVLHGHEPSTKTNNQCPHGNKPTAKALKKKRLVYNQVYTNEHYELLQSIYIKIYIF